MDETSIIHPAWLDAFERVFTLCKMAQGERIAVLSETGSRAVNVSLTCAALDRMGLHFERVTVPTPAPAPGPIIRSTGACEALTPQLEAVTQLCAVDVVIDLTVEGLMHAPETGKILRSGARILNISNEHPDILCRLVPDPAIKDVVKDAVARCRAAREMRVTSEAGTDLTVAMEGAATVGVWGYTDRPGTLAHWPGGLVVSFPKAGSVNGRLVFAPGDINLTFKRYFEIAVTCTLEADFVTSIEGSGTDARLMRSYYAGFDDPLAYATSHVGWGLNPAARYEALTMYDKADLNGTELRALAGNFLYSTGANEFADRFTRGHFDLPMMGCDILLDGVHVVRDGVPV
ncbi:peptidase M29 [Pseudaestuariivita sp.]|uniref:peptidase M29 n=1 Tax=Pseudaestuariivita sp. TaxID=2211669 RepID=UPI00405A2241